MYSFFALQDFDFDALEKSTEYDNGLSESSTVIRYKQQFFYHAKARILTIIFKRYLNVDL